MTRALPTRWLPAFLLLSLCASAQGQAPYDCVCDLSAPPYGGSATLVGISGDTGLVISCAHVFEGGSRSNITLTFRDGYKAKAKLLAVDTNSDLSAMQIRVKPNMVTPPEVVAANPDDGPFTCVGYPWYGQGEECFTSGPMESYNQQGQAEIRANPHVHSGYSGGGLFNSYGEYCGVVCGYTESGASYAPARDTLLSFVGQFMEVGR